jgi:heme/copper-type cytochrome/quinol oxidase subunit 3
VSRKQAAAAAERQGCEHKKDEGVFMSSTAILMWGVIFGSIGLGFFVYGKKQKAMMPLLSGIALMAFPYFISNTYILLLSGIALIALPFLIRI